MIISNRNEGHSFCSSFPKRPQIVALLAELLIRSLVRTRACDTIYVKISFGLRLNCSIVEKNDECDLAHSGRLKLFEVVRTPQILFH